MAGEEFVGEWKIRGVEGYSQHGVNGTTGENHIVRIAREGEGKKSFCVACTRCRQWGAQHSECVDGHLYGEGTFGDSSEKHKFTIAFVEDPLSGKKTITCTIEPLSPQNGSWQPGSWTAEDG